MENTQIVSKERVAERGEVFTAPREVNAMLDLVKRETERIDSRFLESACGKGAFLQEILKRKLNIVKSRYSKSSIEYERYAVLAISSIYGIDIMEDNVEDCRNILLDIFEKEYQEVLKKPCSKECEETVKFILSKNIIWGDALSLTCMKNQSPIIFSQWSYVKGSFIQRDDFLFSKLIKNKQPTSLFNNENEGWKSLKKYPLTHYLRLKDAK